MNAARLLFLAVAIVGASLLAGCGGGEPEDFDAPTVHAPEAYGPGFVGPRQEGAL
ncbi:hypothetical protein [Sphaerotilus sp.]|uniref:hypothetical protein n=1 Tax=Sphaerotilus sp. TaxID=2093942 RepID=UPI0034E2ACA1